MLKDLSMPEQITLTKVEQITLNDGSAIPQIGLGVWQVDPAITAQVVSWGIEAGYRLIDTAEGYQTRRASGRRSARLACREASCSSPRSCETARISVTPPCGLSTRR